MNIVEAYLKFKGQLIIIISGLSGSGKTLLANDISKLLHIIKLNIEAYCKSENNITFKLPNDIVVKDWDHIDTYYWDKINEHVNKIKDKGVIIVGPYFPTNKLEFDPDFHIHLKITKQQLLENRRKYIETHQTECKELQEYVNTPTESLMINQITYPHYMEYLKQSKIDKFININPKNNGEFPEHDEIYNDVLDYLFNSIQKYLDNYKSNEQIIQNDDSDEIVEQNDVYIGATENEENENNYAV